MPIERWGFAAQEAASGGASVDSAPVTTSSNGIDSLVSALGISSDDFMAKYGAAPEGGWTDNNVYGTLKGYKNLAGDDVAAPKMFEENEPSTAIYGSENTDLQGWMKDPTLLEKFKDVDLYGDGSTEAVQRGYNILQHMAPRVIGEFNGLSPEVQKYILQNPSEALPQMQRMANPANGDWLSVGAEGGFSDLGAYQTDGKRLGVDGSKYMQIHNEDELGPLRTIAQIASVIPGPWQPFAMAANATMAAANDNPLGMVLSVAGLGDYGSASLAGDAAQLSNQGLSVGQIADTLGNGNASLMNYVDATKGVASNALGVGSGVVDAAVKYGTNAAIGGVQGGAKGAVTGLLGTAIGDGIGAINPVSKDNWAGAATNDIAKQYITKEAADGLGLIGSTQASANTTSTGTTALLSNTGTTSFRPVKIESWGFK